MNFLKLNQLAASVAARTFAPDVAGLPLLAWFPAQADELPANRAGYVLQIGPITKGPSRHRTRDFMGNLVESEETFSIHLLFDAEIGALPWKPVKQKTTCLIGYRREDADACRILDWQDISGRIEIQLERFHLA